LCKQKKYTMKQIFTLVFIGLSFFSFAQITEDSVVMQPNYTNDIFYSLKDGEVSEYSGSSWTVAFYNKSQSAAIMINGGRGVELWNVTDDITQFSNITDTVGMSTWSPLYDSDTTWDAFSAFEGESLSGQSNYGWGEYDFNTHAVTGTRIFMLKTINDSYYKVYVVKKEAGVFTYRYASLDNSFDTTMVVSVPDYLNKSYAYLNMDNHTLQDREPDHSDWDFEFTKYIVDYQGIAYYPVTGVISNEGVQIAEVLELPANANYVGAPFKSLRTVIGSDWKTFDQMNNLFTLSDSLTFFVRTEAQDIYKVYFTGFEGGVSGKIKFTKELVASGPTAIRENNESIDLHKIYPNPTTGSADLIFSSEKIEVMNVRVYSLVGNLVFQANTQTNLGLNSVRINLGEVENGIYLVQLGNGIQTTTQKLVLNK
jgi:hypothetical protein